MNNKNNQSYIYEGISLNGDLTFNNGTFTIDSQFQGNINSTDRGLLIIGKNGSVSGNIKTQTVIIEGSFIGNCICDNLKLKKNSKTISENIKSKNLNIEDGAKFQGTCEII